MLVDKYKNNFLRGGINKNNDPFHFGQDPTFLSFHLDFFVEDYDISYISDDYLFYSYAHDGLFKSPALPTASSVSDKIKHYDFTESAEDYLYSIGSNSRLASLQSFKTMLRRLQNETPWYFQKVSGSEALYVIDPAVNTLKDGVLTVECLESVDQRVSLLADLYRHAAWDFERKREVLPYNTRTFRMKLHIFEMRNFNHSMGLISDMFSDPSSAITGVIDPYITLRTYELGQCEFDFFSSAPSYMADLSVAETNQATFTFKIKFKTSRLTADYPFYKYVIDNIASQAAFPADTKPWDSGVLTDLNVEVEKAFYDPNITTLTSKKYARQLPGRSPGGILGGALGALESRVNTAISDVASFGKKFLMGNVYDNIPSVNEISQALTGFINPDLGLPGASYAAPRIPDDLGNVYTNENETDNSIKDDLGNVYNQIPEA